MHTPKPAQLHFCVHIHTHRCTLSPPAVTSLCLHTHTPTAVLHLCVHTHGHNHVTAMLHSRSQTHQHCTQLHLYMHTDTDPLQHSCACIAHTPPLQRCCTCAQAHKPSAAGLCVRARPAVTLCMCTLTQTPPAARLCMGTHTCCSDINTGTAQGLTQPHTQGHWHSHRDTGTATHRHKQHPCTKAVHVHTDVWPYRCVSTPAARCEGGVPCPCTHTQPLQ